MKIRLLLAATLTLVGTSSLFAQDEPGAPLVSGPAAGTELTPVKCYATDGAHQGQEFDAVQHLEESPCAILFIHELTRNTAPVIRGLDDLATEHSILGFKSFTVMLSGDRTAGESQLKRVNGSLRLANPIVLSIDGAEGPGNYALNRKAALTLVFAKGGAVQKSIALTDTGPNDVPVIREGIEELTGKIPGDENELRTLISGRLPDDAETLKDLASRQALELRRLRNQVAQLRQQQRGQGMKRPAQRSPMREGRPNPRSTPPQTGDTPPAQREGKPPEDPKLNSLLRSFIRQTNDEARADEVFAEIEARAAESEGLESETIEMFKLMLSFRDRYGTKHAQDLAERFLKEHADPEKKE